MEKEGGIAEEEGGRVEERDKAQLRNKIPLDTSALFTRWSKMKVTPVED